MKFNEQTRRNILRQITMAAAGPMALPLRMMGAAVSPPTDYKALICIYLHGGNDHFNTVVPYDSSNYALLAKSRPGLVPARATLLPLSTKSNQGGRLASLHPTLPDVERLYRAGKVAIVHGVGGMLQPATRSDLESGRVSLPPAAGSHNDGNSMAHTLGREGTRYGWGGRMLDMVLGAPSKTSFTSFNVGFSNAFGSGLMHQQIAMDQYGFAPGFAGLDQKEIFGSAAAVNELRAAQLGTSSNLLEDAYLGSVVKLLDCSEAARKAFDNTMSTAAFTGPDTSSGRDNTLGYAMRTIVRLIQQRNIMQANRQIFFVQHDGFDTHGGIDKSHPDRLHKLNHALRYLQDTLDDLGLSDQVVTFTTSEFGRSLPTNASEGTDHGWGGVSFIMGNPLKGGDIYGKLPDMDPKSGSFQGLGGPPNSIPNIAVEQVGATLARWFGVPDSEMNTLFPLLPRFSPRYLDFL